MAIADTPETIGNFDKFYTNEELLALNADGFVGKPLSDKIDSEGSCIWYGTMSNGDVVMAMFNREDSPKKMSVSLADMALSGECKVRDLWRHADEGTVSGSFEATVSRLQSGEIFKINVINRERATGITGRAPLILNQLNLKCYEETFTKSNGGGSCHAVRSLSRVSCDSGEPLHVRSGNLGRLGS